MSSNAERSSIKCFTPLWVFSSVYLCHRRILSDNPITTIEQEAFKTGFFDHFFLRMWVLLVTKVNIVFLVPSPMLFWCISLHALNVSRRWLQYYNHEIIIIINILVSWTYLRIYVMLMMQNVSNVFFPGCCGFIWNVLKFCLTLNLYSIYSTQIFAADEVEDVDLGVSLWIKSSVC